MLGLAGFHKVKAFENVSEAEVGRFGNFTYLEVENLDGTNKVYFVVNEFPEQGMKGGRIPLKAGEVKDIPMAVYGFRAELADGTPANVNVIAYGGR